MSTRTGSPNSRSTRQTEILVIEDNPADAMLTVAAFQAVGLTSGLRSVKNGEDALAYVRREGLYTDVPVPDVIFLDLSQPKVSGLEVLRLIKATPELMHIPIVVAAGSDNPNFVRSVYALNGNCFIRKPNELGQFLRFIENCYQFWASTVTLSPKPSPRAHRLARPAKRGAARPTRRLTRRAKARAKS